MVAMRVVRSVPVVAAPLVAMAVFMPVPVSVPVVMVLPAMMVPVSMTMPVSAIVILAVMVPFARMMAAVPVATVPVMPILEVVAVAMARTVTPVADLVDKQRFGSFCAGAVAFHRMHGIRHQHQDCGKRGDDQKFQLSQGHVVFSLFQRTRRCLAPSDRTNGKRH